MAEAPTNPELAEAFWNSGPGRTREMLARYFARPEVRAQMRPDVPLDLLPSHLLACISGEQLLCFMPQFRVRSVEDGRRDLDRRLDLFYRSVLPA
jgi:TetR/AcrR family transcriptional repressor of mexJK operon